MTTDEDAITTLHHRFRLFVAAQLPLNARLSRRKQCLMLPSLLLGSIAQALPSTLYVSLFAQGWLTHSSKELACHAAAITLTWGTWGAGTGPDPVSAGVPPPEVEQTQELYKVPCHASWFGYNDIHAVERMSVPDFFNGKAQSKTPKVIVLTEAGFPFLHACMHACMFVSLLDQKDL